MSSSIFVHDKSIWTSSGSNDSCSTFSTQLCCWHSSLVGCRWSHPTIAVVLNQLNILFLYWAAGDCAQSTPLMFKTTFFQETRTLAEIAKAELDGTLLSNRPIRIRFATHSAALKVRNLMPIVTNELLEQVNLRHLLCWCDLSTLLHINLGCDSLQTTTPPPSRHFPSLDQWNVQLLWQTTVADQQGKAL